MNGLLPALLFALAALDRPPVVPASCDPAATAAWRAFRETEFTAPDGWLGVAGLFFLDEGENLMGSNPRHPIVLPAPAPPTAGRIVQQGGRVFAELAPGVSAARDGTPVAGRVELRPADGDRAEDRLTIGRLVLHVHRSGERLAIRLRDPEHELYRSFPGLSWRPIDARWCASGRFVAHDRPRRLSIATTVGDVVEYESPGSVDVRVAGLSLRLLALRRAGDLWIIFSDATAGRSSYKVRYLYAALPDAAGRVLLDFNRVHSPPCAYNPHTTCPLPPPENRLRVAIEAGELLAAAERRP